MEEDKNPKSRSRLKTAGIVLACGLAGIIAVALGLMLADVLIVYAMEGSGEQPMLYVMERAEPGESMVVPLTEQDFADHPALDAVIRGEERNPSAWEWGSRDQRVVGGTRVSYAESRALHDAYGPQGERGLTRSPYFRKRYIGPPRLSIRLCKGVTVVDYGGSAGNGEIMRPKLKRIEGERRTFTGTFARFGKKDRYRPKEVGDEWVAYDVTVLLVDVRDGDGNPVTDHLWFNYTKGFENLGDLQEGDAIRFDARVRPYVKGYVNQREYIDEREVDYKLAYPTKVARVR